MALEHNRWVRGVEYAVLASNKTLRRIIENFADSTYTGTRAADRPDFLLSSDATGKHKLIEFKQPSLEITRAHEAQAIADRDELIRTFPAGIDVRVIGRSWAAGTGRTFIAPGLTVTS